MSTGYASENGGTVLEYGPAEKSEYEIRTEAEHSVKKAVCQLAEAWRSAIDYAWEIKEEKFGLDAAEAMKFFGKDHSFIWADDESEAAKGLKNNPGFSMTYNVVAELVQIFGPYIYHRNPYRKVTPNKPLEFPRESIVDPLLEFEMQSLGEKFQQAVMQEAGPIAEAAIAQGIDATTAQQTAFQQVASQQKYAEIQAKLNEMNAEWQTQVEQFSRLGATQSKSTAKKKAKALIMEKLLNYTPNELNLRQNSRRVVDEAIIKGMGVWWTELKEFDDDDRTLVGSFYDSIDNFLVSGNVANYEDAMWVSRRRCLPLWQAKQRWPNADFKTGKGKSPVKKTGRKQKVTRDGAWATPFDNGDVSDEEESVVVWEIYSKMGIGARLSGVPEDIADKIDNFGDFCYIVICEDCEYPLNLTPEDLFGKDPEELLIDLSWPIPFHKDGEFPCTPLVFHWEPNSPYGMSHIKPGMGELRFLDFIMSHLAVKIQNTSTDIVGVLESAADEVEEAFQNNGFKNASGYNIVRIAQHYGKSVGDIFSIMQKPPFNSSVWDVVSAVAQRLDRRLGLTDRAFGAASTRSRSAADANSEQAAFSIRPEDMANITAEQATILTRKEALAIAWFMEPKDVAPIVGEEAAYLYDELIYKQNPLEIVREYDYRIEANSIRRPSVETDQENFTILSQQSLAGLFQYSLQTNNYEPLNEFYKLMGRSFPTMDVSGMVFSPAQPPPQPQPTPEELQALQLNREMAELTLQAQLQQARNVELQMRLAELQLLAKAETSQLDVAKKQELVKLEIEKHILEMEQKVADSVLQRQLDAAEHAQEMRQDREAFEVTKKANLEGGGDAKMMTNYRRDYRGYR